MYTLEEATAIAVALEEQAEQKGTFYSLGCEEIYQLHSPASAPEQAQREGYNYRVEAYYTDLYTVLAELGIAEFKEFLRLGDGSCDLCYKWTGVSAEELIKESIPEWMTVRSLSDLLERLPWPWTADAQAELILALMPPECVSTLLTLAKGWEGTVEELVVTAKELGPDGVPE